MPDEPPTKKSLAGLGQMLDTRASKDKAVRRTSASDGAKDSASEPANYTITFRKRSVSQSE